MGQKVKQLLKKLQKVRLTSLKVGYLLEAFPQPSHLILSTVL